MTEASNEIGRINVALEYLAECASAPDLDTLLRVAGARVRWVIGFKRVTLAVPDLDECGYWTMTRDDERLQPICLDALPAFDRDMIQTALRQRAPVAGPPPVTGLCHPLDASGTSIGAICFSNEGASEPYTYRDVRFAHHSAQFLATAIARLRQADTIRRQATDLEVANRAKDEFMAVLGHELRNPLSPMITALHLMRLRGMESRELDVLDRQVAHLTTLVDDLLDVSRITGGKIEIRRQPMQMGEVVVRAVETVSPLFDQRRHHIDIDVPPTGLDIHGDPQRLSQVFSNLLTNAAKYSDPGSRIVLGAARVGDRVRAWVRDEGVGIAPEMLDRVFDMFVQQPQTLDRSRGGLGLGLAIARSLVELHGGTVTARSAGIGKGSEFAVKLPAIEAPAKVLVPLTVDLARPVAENRGKRIMVVDDNDDAAEMLRTALQELGYDVAVAHDGPSALDVARTFGPELAVVDIGLPVMDGYELAQHLRRQQPPERILRLIALTGYGQEEDRRRAESAGFDRHLVKPVDMVSLQRALTEMAVR